MSNEEVREASRTWEAFDRWRAQYDQHDRMDIGDLLDIFFEEQLCPGSTPSSRLKPAAA